MQGALALRYFRGDILEAQCSGKAVVTTATGEKITWCGDVKAPLPLLACGHPLQVISLLADNSLELQLSEDTLAVATAWSYGEDEQWAAIKEMNTRGGFGNQHFQCGPRGARHHCAGFHSFLLTVAKKLRSPLSEYRAEKGVVGKKLSDGQLRLVRKLRTEVTFVTDECGLPSLCLPLHEIAALYASLADTVSLPAAHKESVGRLVAALRTRPSAYAPASSFEGELFRATEGDLVVRAAENGLCCAVSFSRGWGLAVKADDGNITTGRTLFLALIENLGLVPGGRAATLLESRLAIRNGRGDWCGQIKPLVELHRPKGR